MDAWESYLSDRKNLNLDVLLDFLRIPSISNQREYANEAERAARWIAERLKKAGMERVSILPTTGRGMVYGEWLHADHKPTVLVYGHYDVWPPGPVERWSHPPFEPFIENGRIHGRGATDDKGNMIIPILVAEAILKANGKLPINLKFLLEGEEEIGSPHLPCFLEEHKELLDCDLVLSADGGQWSPEQPVLHLGSRGACAMEIQVRGAVRDLHSGTYGGAVPNPAQAIVQILASMHDSEGRISIDGFYNQVRPMSESERRLAKEVPFDEEEYKAELSLSDLSGESGYETYERLWFRPTLEINILQAGIQGKGISTSIPNSARAGISCRLVADQEPDRIAELITAHVKKKSPSGVSVAVEKTPLAVRPYLMPVDHGANRIVREVLTGIYNRKPYHVRMGASLPASSAFQDVLGVYTVIFSFNLRDENQHAPNEFFRIDSFFLGQKAYGRLFFRLGDELIV